jgi:hypothetical protein
VRKVCAAAGALGGPTPTGLYSSFQEAEGALAPALDAASCGACPCPVFDLCPPTGEGADEVPGP